MFCDKRAANAMGGKTARACDGCMRKRARWYCVADDAFLCQACDTSIHSANQLASRHERVRLETASSSSSSSKFDNANYSVADIIAPPAWHQGFTRKARTPKQNKFSTMKLNSVDPVVPEIGVGSEDGSVDENENEEQMVCRVPVFDPFSAELCNYSIGEEEVAFMVNDDHGNDLAVDDYENEGLTCELNSMNDDLLPSDLGLAAFAVDVKSLIGSVELDELDDHIKGLDELLDGKEEVDEVLKIKKLKDEEEGFDSGFDMARAWSLEYKSPPAAGAICEEEEKVVPSVELEETLTGMNSCESNKLLRLNYESVISAWASQGSPWTTGTRPKFNPNDFMGTNPMGGILNREKDGEREARVTRYREKRRKRLFSKKIRYQVRKLNAEKRPRMKGRFVKRTTSTSLQYS